MRKALFGVFLVFVMLFAVAASGCIGGGETTTTTETQVKTETKVETQTQVQEKVFIRFAGWSAGETEMKNYQRMISQFESKYPNIGVKYEVITQMFHENILASFGAGVAPDVFYVDSSWSPMFIDKGALYPVSDLADKAFIDQFYPFLLEPFKKGDKLYGLPKDWSMLALFYNKKLFEQAGLTKPPETWEELEQYAKIIAEKTGKPGLAIYLGGFNRYVPVAVSNGASKPWFEKPEDASWFDNPTVKETLTWYINLYRVGKVEMEKEGKTPYVVQPGDVGAGWLGDAFGQQEVAMVISGNWMIPFLSDQFPDFKYGEDWDIAPLPAGKEGRATMAYTVILGINAKTEHPQETWKFVEYLLGPEGQKELVVKAGQTLPSIKGFENDPDMWPQHKKTLSFMPDYKEVVVFIWGPKSGPLEGKFSDAMAAAMRGEMTPEEAIDIMKQIVQEELSG
ncbi:MalE-like maltose/maltodextrin ABC transporter [Palaeococcus pacificus DY20341]|uniref:MalE-like maltose/maltodextrin ABC transporter n=1 Tax=Palaeococcus pacificus DY20341 TaxID=1343739 RepID=A0A075LTE5_9EURY|nr:ABC transporter substrate-binding protein [Palaeococcus pacificus]AIF70030.1 MalE-like maltose/maltodextrin ABC transporter [Palaeococcus pacificus DY20341]